MESWRELSYTLFLLRHCGQTNIDQPTRLTNTTHVLPFSLLWSLKFLDYHIVLRSLSAVSHCSEHILLEVL